MLHKNAAGKVNRHKKSPTTQKGDGAKHYVMRLGSAHQMWYETQAVASRIIAHTRRHPVLESSGSSLRQSSQVFISTSPR